MSRFKHRPVSDNGVSRGEGAAEVDALQLLAASAFAAIMRLAVLVCFWLIACFNTYVQGA